MLRNDTRGWEVSQYGLGIWVREEAYEGGECVLPIASCGMVEKVPRLVCVTGDGCRLLDEKPCL